MPELPDSKPKASLLGLFLGDNPFQNALQSFLLILGIVSTAVNYFEGRPILLVASVCIVVADVIWLAAARWVQRRRRPPADPSAQPASPRPNFFRGVLPLERGAELLGRDSEVETILVKIESAEFRIGCLSGEAGSGKTSLLRAGLVPALEGDPLKRQVVYLSHTTDAPSARIREAVKKQFSNIAVGTAASLREHLSAFAPSGKSPRLLIVCDQFEEFFLARGAGALADSFVQDLKECLAEGGPSVAFLFSVPEPFTDHLREMAAACGHPLDDRHCHRLFPWDRKTALLVLEQAAKHDRKTSAFAPALLDRLTNDLELHGVVWPTALQLVATWMHQKRIHVPDAYGLAGGTRGVLAAYVREQTIPQGARTPELERQIARRLLQLLAASTGVDTRLAKGLTAEELATQVETQLRADAPALLAVPGADVRGTTAQTLTRFAGLRLVMREEGGTYNLANDCLVTPVRMAVVDKLVEEEQRANLLLAQYLDFQRLDPKFVLPFRAYRFIRTKATRPLGGGDAATRLMRRTGRSLAVRMAVIVALAVTTPTLLWPPQVRTSSHLYEVSHARWVLSRDGRRAVSFIPNETPSSWKVGTPWNDKEKLPIPFEDVVISPKSTYLAGKTREGRVYLWQAEAGLGAKDPPVFEGKLPGRGRWLTFSADEKWAALVTRDGKVHVWDPAEPRGPGRGPRLSLRGQNDGGRGRPPTIFFSRTGRWLVAIEDNLHISLNDPAGGPAPAQVLPTVHFQDPDSVAFGIHDTWVAVAGRDGVHCWRPGPPSGPVHRLELPARDIGPAPRLAFSPDGKWLVVRPAQESFSVWELRDPPRLHGRVGPSGGSSDKLTPPISFHPDDTWTAGVARDGGVYVWRLDAIDANLKPSIPGAGWDRGATPKAVFSSEGGYVIGHDRDGSIYAWKAGETPKLGNPAAQLDADAIRFVFATHRQLFCFGGNRLYQGSLGEELAEVGRTPSPIRGIALSPDRFELALFCEKHMMIVERRVYCWGIPLWRREWPSLQGAAE